MTNDKGEWLVTTPGSVTIRRSADDLSVKCEKEPLIPGFAVVKSSVKGMAFGNVLFGGGIGAGVDAVTGAAFDYPSLISVEMGENQRATTPEPQKVVAPEAQRAVSALESQNSQARQPEIVSRPSASALYPEIEQTVNAWAQAWSSRNVDGYLSFYSDNFVIPNAVPKAYAETCAFEVTDSGRNKGAS
ncbi:MAG: nuclear transport factor 2 family protein, partial [Magnetococcus sp. XQGC-1]